MTVLAVLGTRPEAIKLAPVIHAARARGLAVEIVHTGQHPELAARALAVMGLAADHELGPLGATDLPAMLAEVVLRVGRLLADRAPAAVLVHGDTTSALGAALAAKYARVPLAHVEAGLRTGDERAPFPEETHRRLIDALADRCYAPTPLARAHLLREGIGDERIAVTGNPIVDAVERIRTELGALHPGSHVLVTVHRRENLPEIGAICEAVAAIAGPRSPVLWPIHPNPAVRRIVRDHLAGRPHVELCDPLDYRELVGRLATAALVLTDSGGLQEEAACLGRPTLVLRAATERPEVLATGVVALVGTERAAIVARAEEWLARPPALVAGPSPLGDGASGPRIAGLLAEWLA